MKYKKIITASLALLMMAGAGATSNLANVNARHVHRHARHSRIAVHKYDHKIAVHKHNVHKYNVRKLRRHTHRHSAKAWSYEWYRNQLKLFNYDNGENKLNSSDIVEYGDEDGSATAMIAFNGPYNQTLKSKDVNNKLYKLGWLFGCGTRYAGSMPGFDTLPSTPSEYEKSMKLYNSGVNYIRNHHNPRYVIYRHGHWHVTSIDDADNNN